MAQQLECRFGTDFFVSEPRQPLSGEIGRLRDAQADSPVLTKFEVIRRLPMGFWLQLLSKKYESYPLDTSPMALFPVLGGQESKVNS